MPRKKPQPVFPRPWIAAARKLTSKMSQETLGDIVDKSKQAINNYEMGIRDPDIQTAQAILDALPVLKKQGYTVSDFYPKRER